MWLRRCYTTNSVDRGSSYLFLIFISAPLLVSINYCWFVSLQVLVTKGSPTQYTHTHARTHTHIQTYADGVLLRLSIRFLRPSSHSCRPVPWLSLFPNPPTSQRLVDSRLSRTFLGGTAPYSSFASFITRRIE